MLNVDMGRGRWSRALRCQHTLTRMVIIKKRGTNVVRMWKW